MRVGQATRQTSKCLSWYQATLTFSSRRSIVLIGGSKIIAAFLFNNESATTSRARWMASSGSGDRTNGALRGWRQHVTIVEVRCKVGSCNK